MIFRNTNKIRVSLFLRIIVLMAVTAACCRKKDPPIHKIPQEIKDWFWADTGSYWAYEVNGGIWMDTCRVTDVKYLLGGDETRKNEQVDIETQGFGSFLYLINSGRIYFGKNASDQVRNILVQFYSPPNYVDFDRPGVSYYTSSFNECKYLGKIENYKYKTNDFGFTAKWMVYKDYALQSDSSLYYISKGIGITKVIDYTRNTEKNLINYTIKPITRF